MGAEFKEDVIQQESRRADTMGDGDDRQMQGAKRTSMLVGRTKSRHENLERKWTASEE